MGLPMAVCLLLFCELLCAFVCVFNICFLCAFSFVCFCLFICVFCLHTRSDETFHLPKFQVSAFLTNTVGVPIALINKKAKPNIKTKIKNKTQNKSYNNK